jgi:hypothetical protein
MKLVDFDALLTWLYPVHTGVAGIIAAALDGEIDIAALPAGVAPAGFCAVKHTDEARAVQVALHTEEGGYLRIRKEWQEARKVQKGKLFGNAAAAEWVKRYGLVTIDDPPSFEREVTQQTKAIRRLLEGNPNG